MIFKDYFSGQSSGYSRFRPCYPKDLFAYLAALLERHERAWDCGTGSGQAALGLAAFFHEVIASDASSQQIINAIQHDRVRYRIMPAEHTNLDTHSVDLITVAQALHWFDFERFYAEVYRVLHPGGLLAIWCYGLLQINPAINALLGHFYNDIVRPFWPTERKLVEEGYRTLPFPFIEQEPPRFALQAEWSLAHLLGYLSTWSAVRRYQEHKQQDPLDLIREDLERAWGHPETTRPIRWPIALRLGHRRDSLESSLIPRG